MNVTKISIERPTLVVVVFSVLAFLGALSYHFLSYELVPKFTPPVISVVTVYPGASPTEVEDAVSKPIEDAFSSLANIDRIVTNSRENLSVIRLFVKAGSNVDLILQEAQRKLDGALNQLPPDVVPPVLSRFDFDDLPIIRMGVSSSLPDIEFNELVKDKIQPALSKIEGVAQVRVLGLSGREIKVNLDPDKMAFYKVSILQIIQAMKTSNLDFPVGQIKDREEQTSMRIVGRFNSLDEISGLVIAQTPLGPRVRLRDVASVVDGRQQPTIITRLNGKTSLGLEIMKQSDANAVEVSNLVKHGISELTALYSDNNLRFEMAEDTSDFTLEAANSVMKDLGLAVLLVALIMLFFLHSLRNSLIVLLSIPTSIISTFIMMYVFGYSLNLLSLLGLSLSIGILVDDSIVVLENIYRHLEMGKNRVQAAYDGRTEIGYTAVSITLVDVVVFLPIVFAQGIVADLLRQFSMVMVTSTLLSLLVSFTLVPWLSSRFSKKEIIPENLLTGKLVRKFEKTLHEVSDAFGKGLNWAFHHKFITLVISAILFIAADSLVFFGFIGTEFTKPGDRGDFILEVELPSKATLEQTDLAARKVEDYLTTLPEVRSVFTAVGVSNTGTVQSSSQNLAEINVKLVDKRKRKLSTSLMARKVKYEIMSSIPGIKVRPIEINLVGLRDDDAVEVILLGPDQEKVVQYGEKIVSMLEGIPGAIEVTTTAQTGGQEVHIIPDRDKMNSLGISMGIVGATLRAAYGGNDDSKYRDMGKDYPILVKLNDFNRQNTEDVKNLTMLTDQGEAVPVKAFASVAPSTSATMLERTNRSASISIKCQVIGRPAGQVNTDLKKQMKDLVLPAGFSYQFGGNTQRQAEGFDTLMIALVTSILFVYLLMVALYDSYFYPFVVLFSIPLAFIGALLAIALANQTLSIFSILGIIMLGGLVGKNVILVVDFTNKLREKGMEIKEALIEATKLRFRPVLMTNLTMIIGLLPIALAKGAASEWKNGLAWALIGGLTSSMFLSLIIVPVIYYLTERILVKLGLNKARKIRVNIDNEND